jgi:myosin heavy subunit
MFDLPDSDSLHKRVTTIRIKTPGEFIVKRITVREAEFNRDAIAKSVYDSLFRWVVATINATLTKTQTLPWIGILDV